MMDMKKSEKIEHLEEVKGEKKKIKKSVFIFIGVFLIVFIVGSVIFVREYQKSTLKSIKNHYTTYVETIKDTNLFDKNHKKIGSVTKGFSFELGKMNIQGIKDQYFLVKDTDYYLYYKDTKRGKEVKKEEGNSNYLVFNQNIEGDSFTFFQNDKKVLSIQKKLSFPILFSDEKYYYVSYLNQLLGVKKDKKIKVIEKENTKDNESSYVPIFYYDTVLPTCSDVNCVPTQTVKDNVAKLLENGYHSITKEDYIRYRNGYIRLKEKSFLLTTREVTDEVKAIADEYKVTFEVFQDDDGLKFQSSNKKSTREDDKNSVNRYQLKRYTTTLNVLRMANGEDVIETEPVKVTQKAGVPVLNYHFFYDPNGGEACNESICLTVQKFREHLEYLKNNGYTALTMKEFVKWIYGEIDVPEKSVLITIDDGAMGTGAHNGNKLIPLLEEYKMHATLFLIAGWWKIDNYRSDYLEIQSHTYNMHQYGSCGKGELVCANYEEAKKDLETSLIEIKDNTSFCYPFYSYDDEAIQAIKDLGFKVAFAGGNRNATRDSNKYIVPRYPILSDITLNRFKEIVG